ncbi:MAG TPA: enoyl-CoA hydratase-related protein [Candidatus Hypogeohydataceae bacterium YC41]
MAEPAITMSVEEEIALLRINHPPVNALSRQAMLELDKALAELKGAKVIIITGTGNFFSAGADIKELAQFSSVQEVMRFAQQYHEILRRIELSPIPVIASINGHCLGGGLELAMACHIRIAAEAVKLGQPEINLGIIPGAGATQRLPRLIGKGRALEMLLTGEPLTAEEAKAIGLINHVTKPMILLEETKFLAKRLHGKPAIAMGLIIEAVEWGLPRPLAEGLELETKLFSRSFLTEDSQEGIRAFLEKRPPSFKNR